MKIKRILFTVLTLALLVGSVFAVSASADGEAKPDITVISTNLSYEGDLKLIFAVPLDSLGEKVSISVTWTELVGTKKLTKGNVDGPDVYNTSSLPKKTFNNNTECVLIASSYGISAKDLGTRLNIEISSDGRTFTYENGYSVLEYIYTKLYEEEILNAKAGTADAKRRELYLATINFAKYAEKVLYDNLYDDDENLETHADEWIYSNLEGSPKIYKDGDTITLKEYTKLFEYKVENGALVKANDAIGFKDDTITLTPSLSLVENPDKTAVLDEIPADENNIIDFTGEVLECKGLIDIQIGNHKHPDKYVFNEADRYYYKNNEIKPENKTNHYKGEDGVCYEVSIVDGEEVMTPFVEKYYSGVGADAKVGGNSELWYSLSTEVGDRVGGFLKAEINSHVDYFGSAGIFPSYTYDAGKGETFIVDMDLYYEEVNDLVHQLAVYNKQFNFYRRVVNDELCVSFSDGFTADLFYIPLKEWVSLRLEITNPDGGSVTDATLKVYLKSSKTNGLLEHKATVANFSATSQGPFYISDYSAASNTYYIDKISYARVDTTCYHKEIAEDDWEIITPADCSMSGEKRATCGICNEIVTTVIPAPGHQGEFADYEHDANYEQRLCTACGYYERREKNTPIDFSNGVITNDTSKLSVSVTWPTVHRTATGTNSSGSTTYSYWSLDSATGFFYYTTGSGSSAVRTNITNHWYNKEDGYCYDINEETKEKTKTDHYYDAVTTNDIVGGNARLSFSVKDAALMLVHHQSAKAAYSGSYVTVKYTDALHEKNAEENGGRYVVFEFDVRFNTGKDSTDYVIQPTIFDGNGNTIAPFQFRTRNETINVDGNALDTSKYKADGKTWITVRLVAELATELDAATQKYVAPVKLFVKPKDAQGPMDYVMTVTKKDSSSTGHVGRTDNYQARIQTSNLLYDQTVFVDNLSLIRTSDTSYKHSDCSHTMGEWKVTDPDCVTYGTRKRECSKCSSIETMYIAPLGHKFADIAALAPECTVDGYTAHKECTVCGYVEGKETINQLGHKGDWIIDTPYCFENGERHKVCTVCNEEFDREQLNLGEHTFGEWIPYNLDLNFEQRQCEVCNHIQRRERNYAISFENGAIIDAGKKFSISMGWHLTHRTQTGIASNGNPTYTNWSLDSATGYFYYTTGSGSSAVRHDIPNHWYNKADGYCYDINAETGEQTKTDHYRPTISGSVSSGGNPSINFSLVDDVSGKVLKIVETRNSNYNLTTGGIAHTDATRTNSDKYLVAEFDIKSNRGSGSTRALFTIKLSDSGNNTIYTSTVQTYGANFKVDNSFMIDKAGADGKTWFTIKIVTELATEKTHKNTGTSSSPVYTEVAEGETGATHYKSVHNLYAMKKGSDGPMTLIRTYTTYSTYTGNTERSGGYKIVLGEGAGENHTFFLDNLSFIRTSDENYMHLTCAHSTLSDWSITKAPTCTDEGIASRGCECGYTETEYVPALGHDLTEWADINDGKQERRCITEGCGYVIERIKPADGAITFDDGKILDSDRMSISSIRDIVDGKTVDLTVGADDTEIGNPYVWYSIDDAPERFGEKVLKVETNYSKYVEPYKGPRFDLNTTDESNAGDVYTLDFDVFVDYLDTTSSSRVFTQLVFGGYTCSLGTNGTEIRLYGTSLKLGTRQSWISLRAVFTVTKYASGYNNSDKSDDVPGEATLELFVKDANGNYTRVTTSNISASGINANTSFYFSSYSSAISYTYYLDNIVYTRKAREETPAE